MTDIRLDGETADRITALTLAEHMEYLKQDLDKENLHDEDRGRNIRLVNCMQTLLTEYFEVPQ